MTGCSVAGCSNRYANGLKMKSFPKDPSLRAIWVSKVNRPNWQPTKSSKVCEVHFDSDQWEKIREDGDRKLRHDAVPKIFKSIAPKTKKQKLSLQDRIPQKKSESLQSSSEGISFDHLYTCCEVELTEHDGTIQIPPFQVNEVEEALPEANKQRFWQDQTSSKNSEFLNKITQNVHADHLYACCEVQLTEGSAVQMAPTLVVQAEETVPKFAASESENNPTVTENQPDEAALKLATLKEQKTEVFQKLATTLKQKDETILKLVKLANHNDKTNQMLTKLLKQKEKGIRDLTMLVKKRNELINKQCIRLSVLQKKFKVLYNEKHQRQIRGTINRECIFRDDQLKALKRKNMKFTKWSTETISEAAGLRATCGRGGYLNLLRLKLPYPSLKTLKRRLQSLNESSAINNLEFKVHLQKVDHEKACALFLQETPAST